MAMSARPEAIDRHGHAAIALFFGAVAVGVAWMIAGWLPASVVACLVLAIASALGQWGWWHL